MRIMHIEGGELISGNGYCDIDHDEWWVVKGIHQGSDGYVEHQKERKAIGADMHWNFWTIRNRDNVTRAMIVHDGTLRYCKRIVRMISIWVSRLEYDNGNILFKYRRRSSAIHSTVCSQWRWQFHWIVSEVYRIHLVIWMDSKWYSQTRENVVKDNMVLEWQLTYSYTTWIPFLLLISSFSCSWKDFM